VTIYFYRERDAYGFLSNFSAHGVSLKGRYFPTTEHYFQAMKFEGTPHEEAVRLASSPRAAKDLGGDRRRPLRPDWDQVRDAVMKVALQVKFTQHPELREALLATGDETLVEDAPRDYYWGCGQDRTGKNRLGALLMEVRHELRTGA
jgi:ribA/ribD-fused uncharacterized protein